MKVKRPIVIKGDIAYIQLTKGYTAVIDANDVPIVDGFNWCVLVTKRIAYARTFLPRVNGIQKEVLMHRLITGVCQDLQVDHKDGDGLNCRRANMREATNSQNRLNLRKPLNNTSGFKGVSWSKSSSKWESRITFNNKTFNLGYFDSIELAHAAYVKSSAELHGEFGRVE